MSALSPVTYKVANFISRRPSLDASENEQYKVQAQRQMKNIFIKGLPLDVEDRTVKLTPQLKQALKERLNQLSDFSFRKMVSTKGDTSSANALSRTAASRNHLKAKSMDPITVA